MVIVLDKQRFLDTVIKKGLQVKSAPQYLIIHLANR